MLNPKIIKNNWQVMLLFVIVFVIYFISSPGKSFYNYFELLARGFLEGQLYVDQNPSWLNELIPYNGHYYVALPPTPAIVMLPFVAIFGDNFSETFFSILIASLNVVLVFIMLQKLSFNKKISFLVAIFLAFGTNHWYLASVGSSWYLSHIMAIFFILLALIETFTKSRLWLIGFLMGMSFWARTSVLFTLPFFYIYLWQKFWPFKFPPRQLFKNLTTKKLMDLDINIVKNILVFHLPFIISVLIDGLYNYLRFEDISPFAPYKLIQNVDTNTVVNGVYMSLSYIPKHIEALIFKLPKTSIEFPYLIPSLYATAIWFTSPALLFIFNVKGFFLNSKTKLLFLACWAAILPTLFIVIQWAGVGFSQFGYRFLQDFMPFILILVALGVGKKSIKLFYVLLIISILVNLWGVVIINKFGIYTM